MSDRLATGVTRLVATGGAGLLLLLGTALAPAGPAAAAGRAATAFAAPPATVPAADRTGVAAAHIAELLRRDLGDRFGGVWLDPDGQVVAAVTDPAAIGPARATGARPRLVARGEATLTAIAARLDRAARSAPPPAVGWYVDLATDSVVVQTRPGAADAALAFATAAGAPAAAIRVTESTQTPRPLVDVLGGDPFRTAQGGRCTVGFTVAGGFLTAGHCGRAGDLVYTADGQVMGVFQASSFPGNDYAWVRLYPGFTPVGKVRGGPSGAVSVHGSAEAPVGAAICRYGATTGWRCGTVLARNQTVVYADGVVSGLTRTNVCAEPGDSAGPFIAGNQAQGILSGGSGNCGSGGTTFFQPVREPLAAYGLTLLTAP